MTFKLNAIFLASYIFAALSEAYGQKLSVFKADNSYNDITCLNEDAVFKIQSNNPIDCVRACSEHHGCSGAIFYPVKNTCIGLNASISNLTSLPLPGAVYYKVSSAAPGGTSEPATVQTTTSQPDQTTSPSQSTSGTVPTTTPPSTLSSQVPTTTITVPQTSTSPTTTTVPQATTSTPAQTISTAETPLVCSNPRALVPEVSNSQLTASQSFSTWYAKEARFSSSAAWGSDILDGLQYIQVDLVAAKVIDSVATLGGPGSGWFVKSYNLLVSEDCLNFTILDPGSDSQVFPGNVANNLVVENQIVPRVVARCVRFRPLDWDAGIGMRIEVYGCDF